MSVCTSNPYKANNRAATSKNYLPVDYARSKAIFWINLKMMLEACGAILRRVGVTFFWLFYKRIFSRMKVKRDGLFVCSFCACAGRTMLLHFSAFDQTGREFFMSKGVGQTKQRDRQLLFMQPTGFSNTILWVEHLWMVANFLCESWYFNQRMYVLELNADALYIKHVNPNWVLPFIGRTLSKKHYP